MPKAKNEILTVKPWLTLKKNQLYDGAIRQIRIDKKHRLLQVTIENLSQDQAGRLHEFSFGLPVHPGNPASSFLAACHKDADRVGNTISVRDIVGTVVGMRFGPSADGDAQTVTFEQIAPSNKRAIKEVTRGPEETPSHRDPPSSYRKDLP